MQWWVNTIIGVAFVAGFLVVLAAPLALIVLFPEGAEDIATVSKTLIPWVAIVVLLIVFHEGITEFFASLSGAVDRLRKGKAAGAALEFDPHDQVPPDEIEQLKKEMEGETAWAWYYFYSFIGATIYGSQFELLQELKKEARLSSGDLIRFYHVFLQRLPSGKSYEFQDYMRYLTVNRLVEFDATTGNYKIAEHGLTLLAGFEKIGWTPDRFQG